MPSICNLKVRIMFEAKTFNFNLKNTRVWRSQVASLQARSSKQQIKRFAKPVSGV